MLKWGVIHHDFPTSQKFLALPQWQHLGRAVLGLVLRPSNWITNQGVEPTRGRRCSYSASAGDDPRVPAKVILSLTLAPTLQPAILSLGQDGRLRLCVEINSHSFNFFGWNRSYHQIWDSSILSFPNFQVVYFGLFWWIYTIPKLQNLSDICPC